MRKNKKVISLLFMTFFLSGLLFLTVHASNRKEHDEYMVKVLFKNFLSEKDQEDKFENEIWALSSASYLAIDQFNGNGQSDLTYLSEYGVKDLPDLRNIDYSASGKTHRSYTHRGWNFSYVGLAGDRWVQRKRILLNTADSIFDFEGNEKQKESFCALIYYIHILVDVNDDKSYKTQNGLIMDPGGRIDKADIIDELLTHFSILFASQKNSNKYLGLTNAMQKYNAKLAEIVRSEGGINSDEKFALREEYVKELMDILPLYLPEMLKEEKFFHDVFYK